MSRPEIDRLRSIKTLPQLVAYLRDELDWPIESTDADEITFSYEAKELGLDEKAAVKIKEIRQLRPLASGQPWGIFFINFEKKRLPVVAMRRILRALALRKRTSANKAERQAWATNDLLFISAYGEDDDRALTFAHFVDHPELGLAELRVLGWDDDDTPLKLDYIVHTLHEKLRWKDEFSSDAKLWRRQWSEAFRIRHGHAIRTSKELAEALANAARRIKKRIGKILEMEDGMGEMRTLQRAFQISLIHDLDDEGFSDMFAQTLTYGLFSLACRRTIPGAGTAFAKEDLTSYFTSPFLKEMFDTFLGIKSRKGRIDFDELGLSEITDLLTGEDTHMEIVLADFNNKTRGEDPVIHFYERFLDAYDRVNRQRRGVYYTPQPVVSYIVRSVHELLQTEFGLEDGLADTTTWGEMLKKYPSLKLPPLTDEHGEKRTISPDEPFVQILDPATGTATFLVEAIEVIHRTLTAKWRKLGWSDSKCLAAWNEYVPKHLLTRLHAFELMMAPYAIAHMKIGLKLAETGYRFGSDERARIYLTNALEPKVSQLPQIGFEALAHEAAAVNEIKWYKRFTVVIGNPPYSPSICEPEWLMRQLDDWKQGLNETKSDLNREEWKFLRLAQYHCQTTSAGIVGFIINRDFLDGIVKRRMREHLGQSFPLRIAVDLNGDVKGNIADENVFEIAQGVAIAVLSTSSAKSGLRFASRVGTRAQKYADLIAKEPIDAALASLETQSPNFRWVPYLSEHTASAAAEYAGWPEIKAAFGVASSGIQTKRDHLCIAFTRAEMWDRVQRFHKLTAAQAREEFDLGDDGRDWTVDGAKADVSASGPNQRFLCPILYRPFDIRFTYWTGRTKGFLAYPRREVMQHIVGHKNVGMIFNRQIVGDSVSHFGVARMPISHGTFYLGNKGQDYFAPQLAFDDDLLASQKSGRSNFTPTFLTALRNALGSEAATAPEEIFHYTYAVFHSPGYRSRYAEFLKIDFPRLPLTCNLDLFRALAGLGGELTALHLLESPTLTKPITEYVGGRAPQVEKVSWSQNTVWLDKAQATGFKGVREDVWNFHIGGYQVCEKWLKDRKGRQLSADDRAHYETVIVALSETIRLMDKIDKMIEKYGGWPGAFAVTKTERTAPAPAAAEYFPPAPPPEPPDLGIRTEDELPLA